MVKKMFKSSMDDLSKIPDSDTPLSDDEVEVMDRYFPQQAPPPTPLWKMVLYLTALFLVLAGPWSGGVLGCLPYCDNFLVTMGVQTLLFGIFAGIVLKFLA